MSGSPTLLWSHHPVATLTPGPSLARPRVTLDRSLAALTPDQRTRIQFRLDRWLADALRRHAAPLAKLADLARAADAGPRLRSIAAALEAGAGFAPKRPHAAALAALDPAQRHRLRTAGVTIGALDLFAPALLKPAAQGWRALLLSLAGQPTTPPPPGATVLPRNAPGATAAMGYRPFGPQAVRVDLAERLARAAHEAREGRKPFAIDPALATSIGLKPETIARLMAELGFRARGDAWIWRGRPPAAAARPVSNPTGAFAGLANLSFD